LNYIQIGFFNLRMNPSQQGDNSNLSDSEDIIEPKKEDSKPAEKKVRKPLTLQPAFNDCYPEEINNAALSFKERIEAILQEEDSKQAEKKVRKPLTLQPDFTDCYPEEINNAALSFKERIEAMLKEEDSKQAEKKVRKPLTLKPPFTEINYAGHDAALFFKDEMETILKKNISGKLAANFGGDFDIVESAAAADKKAEAKKNFPEFEKEEKKEEENDPKKPRLMKKHQKGSDDRYRKCLERSQQIRSYS